MTDKQIIIDGVDVAECRHFNYGKGYNPETEESVKGACECITAHDSYGEFMYYGICKGRDCYYKQLKRKEQECERLKEEVSLLKESNSKLQPIEDVNSLEKYYLQQLDQLKKENENIINCYKNNLLVLDHEELVNNRLTDRVMKAEKALQEIKEFVENEMEQDVNTEIILQKCEVLDD